MDHLAIFDEKFFSDVLLAGHESCALRRKLLLAPLLAALQLALSRTAAKAGRINSSETHITLPDAIKWSGWINGFPPHSGQMAAQVRGVALTISIVAALCSGMTVPASAMPNMPHAFAKHEVASYGGDVAHASKHYRYQNSSRSCSGDAAGCYDGYGPSSPWYPE